MPRLGVELPLVEPLPSHYRYGVVGRRAVNGHLTAEGVRLYQSDNESYAVDGAASAGKLAGWLELDGERATVGLAARWFWQQYPQSIAAQRRPARLQSVGAGGRSRQGRRGRRQDARVRRLGRGAAGAAGGRRRRPGAAAARRRRSRSGSARSGALPQALAPHGASARFVRKARRRPRGATRSATPSSAGTTAARCTATRPGLERPRTGAYGMWNWGDWNFRGYQDTTKGTDSWGNLEYDTAAVLALTYAASGDADVHDMMVAAARHFIDVDTIYACPARPEWVGMNHPKNPLHFAFELGGPDLGHTWTQGSLAYYYLTGDERGLAAARGIADYLVDRVRSVAARQPAPVGLAADRPAGRVRRHRRAPLPRRRAAPTRAAACAPIRPPPRRSGSSASSPMRSPTRTPPPATREIKDVARAVRRTRSCSARRARMCAPFPPSPTSPRSPATPPCARRRAQRAEQLDLGSWGKPFSINGRIGFRIESLLAMPPRAPAPTHRRRRARHA